jgi:hypothetical protein
MLSVLPIESLLVPQGILMYFDVNPRIFEFYHSTVTQVLVDLLSMTSRHVPF